MAKTKLPKVSDFHLKMLDDKDEINQYYESYINELSLSNKNMISKFWNISKAQWNINKNILIGAQGLLDGNFKQLEELSTTFGKTAADLSSKINELKAANVGREFRTEFSPLFSALSKSYLLNNDVYKQINWATNVSNPVTSTPPVTSGAIPAQNDTNTSLGPNQVSFIEALADALSVKIDEKLALSKSKGGGKKTPEEKKDEETQQKANKFYDKMLNWIGYEKAKNAIAATREEAKKPSIIGKAFQKTGNFVKSALDNILDLPMVISGMIGGFASKLLGALGTGLTLALKGGLKLFTSRFGVGGAILGVIMSDWAQDLLVTGMKFIFGEENTKKIVGFLKKYDFESILTGAGIGLMLGGPIGAIVGGILGKLVADMNKVSIPEIEKGLVVVNEKKKQLQEELSGSVSKIAGIDAEIAKALAEGNTERVKYLENNKNIALAENERLRIQVREQENISARMEADKKAVEEYGWAGKLFVKLSDWGRAFNDLWVAYLTPFESIGELKATTEIKIENMKTWFGEKWKVFTDWVDFVIDLPNKLMGKINAILEEKSKWLYDKTNGWLGSDPAREAQQKNAGAAGDIAGNAIKSAFAPGSTVAAMEGKSDKVNAMMANLEAIEKQRKERANALINAPISNSSSSVVNNTTNSTVQIRSSPIDPLFGERAW